MKKLLIILLIIVLMPVYNFAGTITLFENIRKEDFNYAENVNIGFNGTENDDYDEFVNDISDINIVNNRHNVAVVSKSLNHDTLLIGHSIVAFSFDYLKTLPVDVIGLAGANYPFGYRINKFVNKKYKKIYVWLGINDILRYRQKTNSPFSWYENIIKDIDMYKKIYDLNYTDIIFFTISYTNEPIANTIIDMVNHYLESNYKIYKVTEVPDLDECHFKGLTTKQIVDTCFKK